MKVNDEILKNVLKYYDMKDERRAYKLFIAPMIKKYGEIEVNRYITAVFIYFIKDVVIE